MAVDIRNFLTGPKGKKEDDRKISKVVKKSTLEELREGKTGFVNPVIVTFQNGELNESRASEFSVVLTPKKDGGTDVKAETDCGQLFKDSMNSEKPAPKQIIAIRNRKTNKVKLIEVDSAVLINSTLLKKTETEANKTDYSKDIRALHKAFGGKKVVIRLDQREKVKVNSTLAGDDIKETVADIKVEEDFSLSNSEKESITDLLPTCHRDSREVSKIYQLSEILTEAELEALKAEVANNIEGRTLNPKEYSQFFINCYAEAKKTENNLDDRLAGVLFAESLIKFLKMPSRKVTSKKAVLCSFSSLIHEKLMNEFCIKTDSSITRPLTMRDKCLCYIMAITLICCNYQLNLKLLATVSSVHFNRLSRLARVVGATQVSKDDQIFVLKLPLPSLPKSSAKKTRRK